MRLKQHRQDVKTLNHLAVAGRIHLTVMSIAARYHRMILAMEDMMDWREGLGLTWTKRDKRVIRDAEVGK